MKLKYDSMESGLAGSEAVLIKNLLSTAKTELNKFKSSAIPYLNRQENLEINDFISRNPVKLPDANGEYGFSQDAQNAGVRNISGKFRGYREAVDTGITNAISNVQPVIDTMVSVKSALDRIESLIQEFESSNSTINFEDLEEKGFNVTTIQNANGGEVTLITYTIDGKEYTISELLNAYYTYTGVSMNSVIQGSILAEQLGIDYTAEQQSNILASTNSVIDFAAGSRLFSLANEDDINAVASQYVDLDKYDYESALNGVFDTSNLTEEEKTNYANFIKGMVDGNYNATGEIAVAAGVLGAYGLTGYISSLGKETEIINKIENGETSDDTPPSNGNFVNGESSTGSNWSNGGQNWSGGNNTGGNNSTPDKDDNDKKEDKEEPKTDDELKTEKPVIEPIEVPEVIEMEDASKIPEKVEVDLGEKDYDQMARDALESDAAAIEAHRAEVVQEANALFDSADKTALIEKLKEYGYTEIDIDNIIADRDLAVNALLQGDYNKQLATKAVELATQDNVTDFKSSYGEDLCCHDFYNGEAEQLLSNMSADPGVVTAKTNLTAAETKYNEAVTAANDSITKMNETKTNMETVKTEITTKIAESTDNWRADIKAEYDAEVNLAKDEFVKKHGAADKWNNDQIQEYTKLSDEIKTKYATEIQSDSTKWTEEQVKKYNESIEQYNTAVKEATTSIEASNTAKTEYNTAVTNLETARETFKNNIKNEFKEPEVDIPVIDDGSNGIVTPTPEVDSNVGVSDQDILGNLNITGNSASLGSTTTSE